MSFSFLNGTSHRQSLILLGVFSYFFLMFGNGGVSLSHPDEVFYAQTAKEMLAHHSWLTPYIFDAPQFEKPILFYWLLAAARKFFGDSPFVARFWPAAFGMIGVLASYWMAWLLFRKKKIAFLTGIILTSNFMYIAMSRAVLTDMVLSIWVLLALTSFYWAYTDAAVKNRGLMCCWFFTGLAVLTKGFLGFCFPWAAIFLFLLFKKDLRFLRTPAMFWGLIVFLLVAAPWHLIMYERYGQTFINEYWKNVHLRRLVEAEHQRCNKWYFYLGTILGGMMPWTIFLVAAFVSLWKNKIQRQIFSGPGLFLGAWILAVFVFLQPASSKLASYILPVFPAVSMIIARYIDGVMERKDSLRWAWVLVGLLVILAIGIVPASIHYRDYVTHVQPVYGLSASSLLAAIFLAVSISQKKNAKILALFAAFPLIILVFALSAKAQFESWVTCEEAARIFKRVDNSDSIVIASKFYVRGVRYFTDRKMAVIDINGKGFFSPHPIPFLNSDQLVIELLQKQPVSYAIVKQSDVNTLGRITETIHYHMTELAQTGGKHILRIGP